MPYPQVLIVGRPNVGKSTFFNRLTGKSLALVDNQPGSTRDLKNYDIEWDGSFFTAFDSGGWVPGETESIGVKIGAMLEKKVKQVQALLFLVDAQEGVTPADELVARSLRKYGLPTLLVVNKADQFERRHEFLADFQKLGFDKIFPISAVHGLGIDDLLDEVIRVLSHEKGAEEAPEKKPMRIAVLGKPNVGKSSLVNALLGQNRLIVDDFPGTTHDAIPVIIETEGDPLVMVDTAGIKSAKQQDSRIEKMSAEQSLYELQTCQVVLLLLDGEKGITHQDVTVGRLIDEAFRPVIVLVNKWDIHPKGAEQANAERIIRRQLRHLYFAPIRFISAKTGKGLEGLMDQVKEVFEESCREIPTRKVNDVLQEAVSRHAPPFKYGHQVKILYGYQRQGHPPAFEVFANHPESVTPSYLRYLEQELRKGLGLESTPLHIVMREKKQPEQARQAHHKFRNKFKRTKPAGRKGKK
ncbi:MAG TPA: ribosome biogenesis GTPase Der [bacterium]|nr:ribosome biogenesis GTPase Der [bacterium]